jgi:hypothetical protein
VGPGAGPDAVRGRESLYRYELGILKESEFFVELECENDLTDSRQGKLLGFCEHIDKLVVSKGF